MTGITATSLPTKSCLYGNVVEDFQGQVSMDEGAPGTFREAWPRDHKVGTQAAWADIVPASLVSQDAASLVSGYVAGR
ncbi:MAG: hypothetical protein ACRYGR_00630 [Janthinobacterium lividum]